MKQTVSGLAFLAALLVYVSSVQAESNYDPVTGIAQFDCIKLAGAESSIRAYSLTLALDNDTRFSVASTQEFLTADQCDSIFDVSSNRLVSEMRVFDDIFAIELQYDDVSQSFELLSAEYSRIRQTAMWVVSNGINKLYIGGTIHLIQESDLPMHPAFLTAYELAERAVFEYDPAIPISNDDFERFNLPPGESLLEYMQPNTAIIIDDFLSQFGRSLDDYSRRRPGIFNSILYTFGARSYGFGSGVDDYFIALSEADSKLTGGLETAADQIDAINDGNSQPINWNLTFLLRLAYIQSGQIESDLRQLIAQWREGDIDTLALSNEQYQRSFPQQYESILAGRNRSWIPVIESYLETPEPELILAGFAHFAGPDNVLGLLEERGYSVERYIPYNTPFDDLAVDVVIEWPLF